MPRTETAVEILLRSISGGACSSNEEDRRAAQRKTSENTFGDIAPGPPTETQKKDGVSTSTNAVLFSILAVSPGLNCFFINSPPFL